MHDVTRDSNDSQLLPLAPSSFVSSFPFDASPIFLSRFFYDVFLPTVNSPPFVDLAELLVIYISDYDSFSL